jgi:hypothetical protein
MSLLRYRLRTDLRASRAAGRKAQLALYLWLPDGILSVEAALGDVEGPS